MPHDMLGCPIRKSRDQRFLAAPPSLSQLSTSFFASPGLGIHHLPLDKFNFILRYYLIKCKISPRLMILLIIMILCFLYVNKFEVLTLLFIEFLAHERYHLKVLTLLNNMFMLNCNLFCKI